MAYLADEFPERVGHSALVCGQSIASTLWHDGPFIEAPWCSYGSEVNVVRVYSGLEEGICHVHLAKYFSLPAVGEYVINAGEGEVVSDCVAVKRSIVIYPPGVNSQIRYPTAILWNTECR
jgi:hypothetical protein